MKGSHMSRNMSPSEISAPSSISRRPRAARTASSSLGPLEMESLQGPSCLKVMTELTPPTSPDLVRYSTDVGTSVGSVHSTKSFVPASQIRCSPSKLDDSVEGGKFQLIIECSFEVDISRDSFDRPQLFGQGAWSNVYQALRRQQPLSSVCKSAAIPTPPPSPQATVPLLVAVKSPVSNASRTILHNEAIILSHLSCTPDHENFIVPFYGYIPSSASLVLAPVPLSLSDYIAARARLARTDDTHLSRVEPVLGSTGWLCLAEKLVTALAWLHEVGGVIHGDIKPGNILLSPNRSPEDFTFDPLLIDFSSSHILSSTDKTLNTLSALTREYAAPELLSPGVLRDPSSTATSASDVFSLAVTLIVAVTGDLMVYNGSVLQRQYMATQGWDVLEFVRNGTNGTRVPSDGIVQTVVERAVRKVEKGRIDAATWKDLVRALRRAFK
jgi:Protein kinase domain